MLVVGSCGGSCGGDDTISGGGIKAVTVLAGGSTDTITVSGGEEVVTISGGGGGVASLATSGAEVARSGGGGVVRGAALSSSPLKPFTMLLKPLTPWQISPSRFLQKFGRSDMFIALTSRRSDGCA